MTGPHAVPTPQEPRRSGRSPKHAARDALELATPAELGIGPMEAFVLFKLIARLNHRQARTSCWPKQPRLAEDTGIPVRTLKRYLQNLQRAGLVKIHRTASRGQPNEYVIDVEELCRRAGIECNAAPMQQQLGRWLAEVG